MENAMVKNMSMAFISEVTEHHSSSKLKKTKPISEEEKEKNMKLIISEVGGDTDAYVTGVIASYVETLSLNKMHILVYPTNLDFDYSDLVELLHFHINNAGDPFIGNRFSLNSTAFELCVLDWFAKLWEIEKNEYWGYVTTGGTEGNLHGILVGRELYPEGILYTSEESHYSLFKIARMYRMKCVKIRTLTSGEMDCTDLKSSLLANKDRPAIINVNIGTTVKGAVDDLDLVIQMLEETNFTHGKFYIHCDGALFGMMLPFIKRAHKQGTMITFKKPIGSVAISGHKFLGSPIPCDVVMTRAKYINTISNDIEIIASRDATITGSRCGHAPIFIWFALNKKGFLGLKKDVEKCVENASYLRNRLRGAGISAMLNEFSSTVVLERPLEDGFARKWNLACKGNIAHVVVMQHVTVEMLDTSVSELVQKRFVLYQDGQNQPPCLANDIGAENCACILHK